MKNKSNKYRANFLGNYIYIAIVSIAVFVFTYIIFQTKFFEKFLNSDSPLLFKMMFYYLILIFLRTVVHLFLSFLDYLFTKRLPETHDNPLVTILMPCYNEEIGLENAVKSVLNLKYPNKEILIIDDGSTDKTLDIGINLSKKYNTVRVITQKNGGKANALNYGLSQALGDYVLCMDSDSILSSNCINMAMKYFWHYPNLAAMAGGVSVKPNKNMLTWFQELEYIIGLNFFKNAQSALNIVTIVPGPIGVFKKDIIKKIGGFKSDTFAEDADLSMRLLMAGYDIKYCAAMKAITEAPDTVSQWMTQRYRWSRGIIQALKENIKNFNSHSNRPRAFFILSYMFGETIFIPTINFVFAIATIQYALQFNITFLLGPYFIGLTILDIALSLYSIVMEKRIGALFVLSIINRLTYGLSLEVVRFFSLIDEVLAIPMRWGTMIRKGIKKDIKKGI